ncbi:hypothetical protein KZQ38_35005 [Saccharothrix sp. SC076]|nr:hypothetical protein [Saccharothrix obliqua]
MAGTWRAIQARHPDVPDVAIVIGSGTGGRRKVAKLGHFASRRWLRAAQAGRDQAAGVEGQEQPEQYVHELLIGGEGLARGPLAVLATSLHEATHALAEARSINDTSGRGVYHNKRFKVLAEELGLEVAEAGHRGWAVTSVPDTTAARYAEQLAALEAALTVYRVPETTGAPGDAPVGRSLAAVCACTPVRRLRIARATFELGPIICAVCEQPFTLTG